MTESSNSTTNSAASESEEPSKEDKIKQLREALAGFDYALMGMAMEHIEIPDDMQKEYHKLQQQLDELTRT